jgi:cell division protein ZapE
LPSEAYRRLITEGRIEPDEAQRPALLAMDRLCHALAALPSRKSGIGWLFHRVPAMPKGLYLWGSVGRGKTMLMDLMFASAPIARKRRVHFQNFMADVHDRIHAFRQRVKRGEVKDTDPIPPVAASLATEARLLCLDEMAVTDIADAMILSRLFEALFAEGTVLVTTSNLPPARLYENGLNRALFLPFLALLAHKLDTVEIDSATDHRLGQSTTDAVYFTPVDGAATASLDAIFEQLIDGEPAQETQLRVKSRVVRIPRAGTSFARFAYADLCRTALGNPDFIALAKAYPAVMIDAIPIIHPDNHNEAKRFIALIDALYDQSVKLYVSAAAPPDHLYTATDGREAFEFARTASRLIEMQSETYRALPHGRRLAG